MTDDDKIISMDEWLAKHAPKEDDNKAPKVTAFSAAAVVSLMDLDNPGIAVRVGGITVFMTVDQAYEVALQIVERANIAAFSASALRTTKAVGASDESVAALGELLMKSQESSHGHSQTSSASPQQTDVPTWFNPQYKPDNEPA